MKTYSRSRFEGSLFVPFATFKTFHRTTKYIYSNKTTTKVPNLYFWLSSISDNLHILQYHFFSTKNFIEHNEDRSFIIKTWHVQEQSRIISHLVYTVCLILGAPAARRAWASPIEPTQKIGYNSDICPKKLQELTFIHLFWFPPFLCPLFSESFSLCCAPRTQITSSR